MLLEVLKLGDWVENEGMSKVREASVGDNDGLGMLGNIEG